MSSGRKPAVRPASAAEVLPLRARYREEMSCQIVHDSIHRRTGWTQTFALESLGATVGFASLAIGGPWTDRPTVVEFYLLPALRTQAFAFYEAFLLASGARFFEAQSNDVVATVMAQTYGRDVISEKIVLRDGATTTHAIEGVVIRQVTPQEELVACVEARQGGGEWLLELDGQPAASGGILFHYNRPYGDLYMEVDEPHRRRGLGTWLVQELKRACYALGALPGARCSPDNVASRATLQRAGFVPFAHILSGSLAISRPAPSPRG